MSWPRPPVRRAGVLRAAALLALLLLLSGCAAGGGPASGDGETADAEGEAPPDAGQEPTADAGQEPAPDAEEEAPPDAGATPPPQAEGLETAEVALVGEGRREPLTVYLADTPALRREGLMGWERLPEGTGMLFVFDEEREGGFWMKDTLLPLSIAFADAEGHLVAILDMEPCEADPCPTYDPDVAYRYALEVEQGALERRGVDTSWSLELPSGLAG
ncbi:MAG: DUF192 domain-containing protein [Egibacteraceae bacterium]